MPFTPALRNYFRILAALLRREGDSRRHAPLESIANLLEPLVLIAMLGFIFYFAGTRQVSPLGGNPVLFFAAGFFPLYFFIYLSRRMRGSIDAPARRFPIEQRLDHIIVHIILRFIDYAILGIVLFGGLYIFFTPDAIPHDLVPVILACVAIVMLGFGWGILILVLSKMHWFWNFLLPAISRSLMLFSGIFYVPDFFPPPIRYLLSFNPLLHAIALFKTGFYPSYPAIILDTDYLSACAIFAVFFGLVLERVTRRAEGR